MPPDLARGQQLYDEAVASLEPTPELELTDTLELQTPPQDGPFDLTCLRWHRHTLRNVEVHDALIPADEVERFANGEAARCDCDAFTTSGVQPGAYAMFACPCAGAAKTAWHGPRAQHARGPTAAGSKKVGCPVRFSVNYRVQPGLALVRYHAHQPSCCTTRARGTPRARRRRRTSP